jgi:phosphoribosylformylglycinamidine cyclo-ligase
MARTFNCGVGMAVIVSEGDVAEVTKSLGAAGETVLRIGHISAGDKGCTVKGSDETWSARAAWSATHLG